MSGTGRECSVGLDFRLSVLNCDVDLPRLPSRPLLQDSLSDAGPLMPVSLPCRPQSGFPSGLTRERGERASKVPLQDEHTGWLTAGGMRRKVLHFADGGDCGSREEYVNDLIARML